MNVLFLCTGDSCRSLISEAVFNHLAPSRWHAGSAGSHPTGKLNERALALLAAKGMPTDGYCNRVLADRGRLGAELERFGHID